MLAHVRTHCVGPDEQVVIMPLAQPKTAKVEGDLNGAQAAHASNHALLAKCWLV